jgi:hypothetical protein
LNERLEITIEPSLNDEPILQADASDHGVYEIKIPDQIQSAFDEILDFYAQNGQKPLIKLCGNPLDAVTGFIQNIKETLPENLINSGKDMMDFIIHQLCEFCRDHQMNYMTFHFTFDRGA